MFGFEMTDEILPIKLSPFDVGWKAIYLSQNQTRVPIGNQTTLSDSDSD